MKRTISLLTLSLLCIFAPVSEAFAAMKGSQIRKEISGTYRFNTNSGFSGRMTLNRSGSSKVTYSGYGSNDIIKGDWGVNKQSKICITLRNTSRKKRYGCFKVDKVRKGVYKLVGFGTIRKK